VAPDVVLAGHVKRSPEIFRFLEENVLTGKPRVSSRQNAPGASADDLIKPSAASLPTASRSVRQSVELLKQRGVDAIISFRATA